MINVSNYQFVISESSSKGNQRKFYKDGYWFKIDNERCFEGLAEEFVSLFCSCIYDFSYVPYKADIIVYNDEEYTGCYSYNMYNDKEVSFVSLRKIFRSNNIPLNIFHKETSTAQNIMNTVSTVQSLTGLNIFHYLNQLLYLDALIVNEDRHYMNIGVCLKGNQFLIAPCFDNGSSLFCVNWTYRKTKSFEENIKNTLSVARPFSKFYIKQIQALQSLGAKPLFINKQKLDLLLTEYNSNIYPANKVELIKSLLRYKLDYFRESRLYAYV